MKNYLLGVDLGTTNVKAAIYDLDGQLISMGEAGNYPIISKHMNWAEQDAGQWWDGTVEAIRQAIGRAGKPTDEIAGISVSSQGMAMLPLDEKGEPLTHAHIWMDRRAVKEANYIEEVFGTDRIQRCFGVRSDPYYQITNILWYKWNQPDLWKKTKCIVKANTYLNFKLTGEIAMDEPQAMMTMCYDIHAHEWCHALGDVLDIDFHAMLPKVGACSDLLGCVTREAAAITGLAAGTPVVIGGADTALALLEMGIMKAGDAGEITGTSSNNVFAASCMPPADASISFFPPVMPTENVPVLLYGPTNATGENVRWFRRICGLENSKMPDGTSTYQYLEKIASAAKPGGGGLYFYPYLMGERAPLWNSDLRGMLIGANTNTDRGEILRAIYEGVCFAQREICEEACRVGGIRIDNMYVSGGCARSDVWMRIKASVLNQPIHVMTSGGGAPKGDAILAGYGVGIYKDLYKTVAHMRCIDQTIEPDKEWAEIYRQMYPMFIDIRNHLMEDMSASAKIFKSMKHDGSIL